tara:strand:- start:1427 stop:2368 length:942 start_codon:yes stop_codon:yes gene_type:complete
MSRTTLFAVGAGIISALLYLSLLTGTTGALIFAYLSSLPLFVAGLSLGIVPLLVAAATGTLVTGIGDEFVSAAMYGGLTAGPVIWIVHLAMLSRSSAGTVEWYPAGRLITWLSAIAGGYFLIAIAAFSALKGGIRGQVESFLTTILEKLAGRPWAEMEGAHVLMEVYEPLFPAMVGVSWIIMMSLNGILAQGLLSRFGKNLRPSPTMAVLQLPRALAFMFAAALLASLAPSLVGYAGTTISVYIMVPYLLLGLAVVHALASKLSSAHVVLVIFYVVLVLFGLFGLALTAGLGLVEQWFNVRRRCGVVYKGEEE